LAGKTDEEMPEERKTRLPDLRQGRPGCLLKRLADVLDWVLGHEPSDLGLVSGGPERLHGLGHDALSFPRTPNLTGCRSSLGLLLRQQLVDARARARRRAARNARVGTATRPETEFDDKVRNGMKNVDETRIDESPEPLVDPILRDAEGSLDGRRCPADPARAVHVKREPGVKPKRLSQALDPVRHRKGRFGEA
jgi:hypothetical protein